MQQFKKGTKLGKLIYVGEAPRKTQPSGQKPRRIFCKCFCGNVKDYLFSHIVRGRIATCGCTRAERGNLNTPLHNSWRGMKNRVKDYRIDKHIYYDRGIKVCKEWENFNTFKKWAIQNGYKEGLTIDRIDNDKGYFPDNCRWVTSRDNCNNRRNTYMVIYRGKKIPFTILLREKGLIKNMPAIRRRIQRGWSVDNAIDTKIKTGKYYNTGYIYEWA